jgi:murein DD-endopeptidase MepM/ murein hydrolase activator NlpD
VLYQLLARAVLVVLVAGVLSPRNARAQTRFRLPFDDPKGIYFLEQPIVHADHDPEEKPTGVECINYAGQGFPWCYDQHKGTDFLLKSGFATMDTYDVPVVAAADGEVIAAEDGHYDRCHGQQGITVSCDGHPIEANHVDLRHADGLVTTYYHLKKGSVKVAKGEQVTCGQLLGYVGSSGMSALPHLHFGLQDADGSWIDPFAGPKSQPLSYWVQQQGPRGRPEPRCQGEPPPPPDGGTAPDQQVLDPDAGAPVDAGGDSSEPPLPPRAAMGCRLAVGSFADASGLVYFLLLFGALLAMRQRGADR